MTEQFAARTAQMKAQIAVVTAAPPASAPVPPVLDASNDESRGSPRKSLCLAGLIHAFPRRPGIPCKVSDMSAGGAAIQLLQTSKDSCNDAGTLPETFKLVLKFDQVEVDCVVAWHTKLELGVRFLAPPRLIPAVKRCKPRGAGK